MPAYIDIVGRCNLKCPSCPMGNSFDKTSPGGFMPPELLLNILGKLTKEKEIDYVGLYNWTEPLLHPRVGEMIQIVKSFDVPCYISTNLNISKRLEEAIKANPDFLRISVSGFTNSTYQKQHKGGDIEVVKSNMELLAELRNKHKATTQIQVYYLRWIGNMDEEFLMQSFAENLGFTFQADWTWLSPIEKVVSIVTGDTKVSDEDLNTAAHLTRPFEATILTAQKLRKHNKCPYLSEYVVLDCTGRVSLCCGVYDQNRFTIGSYLDNTWEEIVEFKNRNSECTKICQQCMGLGLPLIGMGIQEINDLATINVLSRYAGRLGVTLN